MVGYCTGSYMERYLAEVLKFKSQNLKHFRSAENYFEGFKDKNISAAFLGTPYAKIFLAKYCNSFIQIGPTYKIGGFGFVRSRAHIFIHLFHSLIIFLKLLLLIYILTGQTKLCM
jgi:hypothetical protein